MKVMLQDGTTEHITVGSAIAGKCFISIELTHADTMYGTAEQIKGWLNDAVLLRLVPVSWAGCQVAEGTV